MSTAVQPAINVVAGSASAIVPPGYSDIGNNVDSVVIFNQTQSVLQVTGTFGSRYLQPLMADVFPCQTIQSAPFVTPITFVPSNTYLGTITSTFYYKDDEPPSGFPMPLTGFPGGAYFIQNVPSGTGFWPIKPSFTLPSTDLSAPFVIPSGAGALQLPTILIGALNPGGATTIDLVGVQTGTIYQSFSTPSVVNQFAAQTIPLVNAQDTTLQFKDDTGGAHSHGFYIQSLDLKTGLYATPGTPIPTEATAETGSKSFASASVTLLAAPTTGANYLFGWSFVVDVSPANSALLALDTGGLAIDYLSANAGDTSRHAGNMALNGLRTTKAVTLDYIAGSALGVTANATLRYAPGP